MQWTIIILIILGIIVYKIGFRLGFKKGEIMRDFKMLNEGFRNGRKSVEEEICEMKGLPDDEIVRRIRNFVKNCKN